MSSTFYNFIGYFFGRAKARSGYLDTFFRMFETLKCR
jgi:hypothetical protein